MVYKINKCLLVSLVSSFLNGIPRIVIVFIALSVSVGVWTLVAISLERYFAIVRPLASRKWQTRSHAYKMIAGVWVAALVWNSPITFVSQLQPMANSGTRFTSSNRFITNNPNYYMKYFVSQVVSVVVRIGQILKVKKCLT